jgi:O-antigen ligase
MDHIAILFKEYETLRAEIIARLNHSYQILGIGTVALTWILSRPVDRMLFIALGALIFAVAAITWKIRRDLGRLSARLREVEVHINTLAGERLLGWETTWSSKVTGWFWRKRSKSSVIR